MACSKKYLLQTHRFAFTVHDCNRLLKTSHGYLYPSDKCVGGGKQGVFQGGGLSILDLGKLFRLES